MSSGCAGRAFFGMGVTLTIDITPEAVERLAYNLSDWGQHDEGLINDYRDDAAITLRALSAALELSQAGTTAAYYVAALVLDNEALDLEADASRFRGGTDPHHYRMNFAIAARRQSNEIRALTPADSKAALDRMIAEARADGMREARADGMREAAGIADECSEIAVKKLAEADTSGEKFIWWISNARSNMARDLILAAIPKGKDK